MVISALATRHFFWVQRTAQFFSGSLPFTKLQS